MKKRRNFTKAHRAKLSAAAKKRYSRTKTIPLFFLRMVGNIKEMIQ